MSEYESEHIQEHQPSQPPPPSDQERREDGVSAAINEKLAELSTTTTSWKQQRMSLLEYYRAPLIGREYEPFYEPEIIRIGLHHPHSWFQGMFKEKYKYLQLFLKRRKETSVDRYVMAMRNLVERALKCYQEDSTDDVVDRDWFVEVMLLDSCFIVELFRKYKMGRRHEDDPIFNERRNILHVLQRDLISIQNQLPFFVLLEFFNMTSDDPEDHLIELALYFFQNTVGHNSKASSLVRSGEINHLLCLVHYAVYPDFGLWDIDLDIGMVAELGLINYATELQECGVKFKSMWGKNLADINFKNGVMEIPPLKVADNTLCLLEILMEYEKQFPVSVPRYVNDYAKFMQCLVNSPKDVEVLRRSGIIENWLGNDEAIFNALNNLGSKAIISRCFIYWFVMARANEHCRHRRNRWMANLSTNYFNSPWSLISFLAAVVLLVLTLLQTIYSILSYQHH